MPPVTRRSLRNQTPSVSSTTNTANPSPLFGSTNASVAEDSPATTDIEQVEPVKGTKSARSKASNKKGKKRTVPSDDEEGDEEEAEEEEERRRAPKRRAVTKRSYVQVSAQKKVANKGKGKNVSKLATCFALFSVFQITKANTIAKGKGKGKGKAAPAPPSDDEDIEPVGLDYDDNRSLIDSQSSGSEFVASDSEESLQGSVQDSDAEATRTYPTQQGQVIYSSDDDQDSVMLEAALHLSLQTGRNIDGAGPSSGTPLTAVNTEAARRAAAIERRLAARSETGFDVDDSAMDFDNLSSLSDSDEEPLSVKSKAKGKSKLKSKSKQGKKGRSNQPMSVLELRKAERKLRHKLGRKLTWVRRFIGQRAWVLLKCGAFRQRSLRSHCINIILS